MGGININEGIDTLEIIKNKASTALATAGTSGLMPAVGADTSKYLGADLGWHTIAAGGDMAKSTYDPDLDGIIAAAQLDTSLATTTNIASHAALTSAHSLNTASTASSASYSLTSTYAAHTTSDSVHGAGTVASMTSITAHAALTSVHSLGTASTASSASFATTTIYAAHTTASATHGVAGTIAAKADITDAGLITTDVTTNNASTTKHGFLLKSTADTSLFLRNGDPPSWIAPAGGSDPWVYKTLTAAFTTASATAQAVTVLAFTPSANTKYDIFGMFMVKTASTAFTPRIGLAWPTGLTDGVATIYITQAATTQILVNLNFASSGLTAVGAIASTAYWPAQMNAIINAGATPSGSIQIQFCSEAANTAVDMGIGSFIKYRSYT